ncbi:MAG: hypothetical protein ACRDLN_00935 [Solirubrobacteraceae bacterium]
MSSDKPLGQLSGDEVAALAFAARRQITRWSNRPDLQPRKQAQRAALIRAVRVLGDKAFVAGCELHRLSDRSDGD